MFDELFSSGMLNLVYTIVVVVSFLYALVSLLGAEVGDALDFDLDVDADTGIDFISISPFSGVFGTTFGLVGLITRLWLDMGLSPAFCGRQASAC